MASLEAGGFVVRVDRFGRVRRWTRALFGFAFVAAASCSDHSALDAVPPGVARLALAPRFATTPAGGPVITLSRIDAYLISPSNDSTFATAPFSEGAQGTATLSFDVRLAGSSALFTLDLTGFDANGVAVYHARQEYTINAGVNDGLEPPVLVYSAPDSKVTALRVSAPSVVLSSGASTALTVTGTGADNAAISPIRVGWTSKDPSVATVDDNGAVHAGQFQGKTYIVARTATGVADSALLAVHAPVDHIVVGPTSVPALVRGRTTGVVAELRDAGGHLIDDRTATFSSSDQTVATVSAAGVVTGVKVGTATITAGLEGKTGTIAVAVVSPIASVEVTPPAMTFASFGESQTVTTRLVPRAGEVVDTFTTTLVSSNPSVASFDGTSLFALTNGATVIRATADGVVGTATVTVQQVPASLTLTPASNVNLLVGGLAQVSARVTDARQNAMGNAVTWSSSNPAVATVSSTGLVTAVAAGASTITATAGPLTKSVTVSVTSGISGRILSSATGAGIAGATVTAPPSNSVATSNADGTFTISNVPAGSNLQIAASGFVSTTYFNVATANGSIGTIPLVSSTVTASGSFNGHFVDATTRGHIPSVTLAIRSGVNSTTGATVQQFTTDTTGAYNTQLAPGTYTITGSAPGYVGAAVTVAVTGGSTLNNFDIVVSPAATGNTIRIVLTWSAQPEDLDSHLLIPVNQTPNEVAYYQVTVVDNTTQQVLGTLDHDEVNGFGPETITIPSQIAGTYHYFVHHYSGSSSIGATAPTVDVYRGATQIAHYVAPPNQGCGEDDIWSVFDLNGANLTTLNYITCASGAAAGNRQPGNRVLLNRIRSGATTHTKTRMIRPLTSVRPATVRRPD